MANHNPRSAKINRSYTVEEVADLYDIHRNTVRSWLKQGLSHCGEGHPKLILGSELRRYLEERKRKNKHPCKVGQIYCMRCRKSVPPKSNEAVLHVPDTGGATLQGICPNCSCKLFRKVSMPKLADWRGELSLTNMKALERLD